MAAAGGMMQSRVPIVPVLAEPKKAQSCRCSAHRATSGCGLPQQPRYGSSAARPVAFAKTLGEIAGAATVAQGSQPDAGSWNAPCYRSPTWRATFPQPCSPGLRWSRIVTGGHAAPVPVEGRRVRDVLDPRSRRVPRRRRSSGRPGPVRAGRSRLAASEAARAVALPVDWLLRDLAAGIAERGRRPTAVSRVTLSSGAPSSIGRRSSGSERPMRTFISDVPHEHAAR